MAKLTCMKGSFLFKAFILKSRSKVLVKYPLVISVEEKNKYILTKNLYKVSERAGVDKICVAYLLKTHLGVEMDTQDGKSSHG